LNWWLSIIIIFILSWPTITVIWILREYHSIPPDERRPPREIIREVQIALREMRREIAEVRAVRRRMDEKARAARKEIYDEQFERTREELRREREN
jgi:hypothetical protein